jgi:multidrug efflux pump subunit AcrA (membrane-fusion protein)
VARILRLVISLAVLAAAVAGALQWISRRPAAQEAGPSPPRLAPLVRTAVVDPTLLVEQSTLAGEVRASATVDITSRMAGRLGAVLVREGSSVAAGGLVARIDDPELELAVRQAEAAVEVARALGADPGRGAPPGGGPGGGLGGSG